MYTFKLMARKVGPTEANTNCSQNTENPEILPFNFCDRLKEITLCTCFETEFFAFELFLFDFLLSRKN